MKVFSPSPHVLVFVGLSEAAAAQALTVPGTGQILGAAGFAVALVMAWLAYRRDRRDREAEQARQLAQHDENLAASNALAATILEMQHHLFGVHGMGGQREEMLRTQKFRHATRQDLQVIFGVLHDHNGQLVRLSDHAAVPFEPVTIERRRRRAEDGEHE